MRSIFTVLTLIAATSAEAQSCGGSFSNFVDDLKAEARATGYPSGAVDAFFRGILVHRTTLFISALRRCF